MQRQIEDVRRFWEENPLWAGEAKYPVGSKEYFDEHRSVMIGDCYAGDLDRRFFPEPSNQQRVLDLGCGPGFWIVEFWERGCRQIVGADLTRKAIELAQKRCEIFGVEAVFKQQNAESLDFDDESFSHVNCQGVIHHTPDTQACVCEIARVLKKGGTACVSVYYRNCLLRAWPILNFMGRLGHRLGWGLKGRGREDILAVKNADEIVRIYDGDKNPIGKSYSRREFVNMFAHRFRVEAVFYHFFPARALPFRLPRIVHRFLDRHFPFMIYALLRKV